MRLPPTAPRPGPAPVGHCLARLRRLHVLRRLESNAGEPLRQGLRHRRRQMIATEFEYANNGENIEEATPGLRTFIGNVLVQTPFAVAGFQPYATAGIGMYRERLDTHQESALELQLGRRGEGENLRTADGSRRLPGAEAARRAAVRHSAPRLLRRAPGILINSNLRTGVVGPGTWRIGGYGHEIHQRAAVSDRVPGTGS